MVFYTSFYDEMQTKKNENNLWKLAPAQTFHIALQPIALQEMICLVTSSSPRKVLLSSLCVHINDDDDEVMLHSGLFDMQRMKRKENRDQVNISQVFPFTQAFLGQGMPGSAVSVSLVKDHSLF